MLARTSVGRKGISLVAVFFVFAPMVGMGRNQISKIIDFLITVFKLLLRLHSALTDIHHTDKDPSILAG